MRPLLILAWLLLTPPGGDGSHTVALVFQGDPAQPGYGRLAVAGLPARTLAALASAELDGPGWARILSLTVGDPGSGLPPIAGDYAVDAGRLVFTPRFPPRSDLSVHGRFDGERLARLFGLQPAVGVVEGQWRTRAAELEPTTRIVAIYPATPTVPANLLRIYLLFSAPMAQRDVARHVRVLDADGRPIELPFVEIEHGLWDREGRRLTLFFHPGRLKRGVGPNLAMGPPLQPGRSYTLEVDAGLEDRNGQPLAEAFRGSFAVGPVDRETPDPKRWSIEGPREPTAALRVDLGEPLDHALLHRLVWVETGEGNAIAGRVTVGDDATSWQFIPESPWRPGGYRLVAAPGLEDLAGNRIEGLFDAAVEEASNAQEAAEETAVVLPFRVDD